MMPDYALEETLDFKFTTRAFATGIPTVLAGSPVIEIYEDNSVTQITVAETLTVDFDGVVGLNNLRIVATGANGFETGKSYAAVISVGTVGGVSVVGEVVAQFSIERSSLGARIPAALVGGRMDANMGAISGDATAADNLETMTDRNSGFYHMYAGRDGPGVWIDDAAANTNTVVGVDGTPLNPVSTIAAATTLATSLGLQRFYLINDTAITLAQTYEGYEFIGIGEISANAVTLGSQDVDTSEFKNLRLTGTQGGTGRLQASRCVLDTLDSLEITGLGCLIMGTLTVRNDGAFDQCGSTVAGSGTPILDINSVANVNVYWRHYSGGLQVNNAVATTVMSFEADGQIIIDATCTSLDIVVRGNLSITDNGTTTVLRQDAAISRERLVDDIWDEILTGATHNIATSAGRRLRNLQDFGLYEGGAVWIDTVDGTAGVVDFENGTVNNPVDSIADALTIANSVGLHIFHVLPGSSITLAASVAGFEFIGFSYSVALGGQSISGTLFNGATITGNDAGTNAVIAHFHDCTMSGTNTVGHHMLRRCRLAGDIILAQATDYVWEGCYSGVAGTGTPSVDVESAVEVKTIQIRHYSGGIEFKNLGAGGGTHTVSLEGKGQFITNANCTGGTMVLRGHFEKTLNGSGLTLTERVNFESILDDGTAVYDRTTDSLQAIRDHATTVKTDTAAIKVKTDALPDSPTKNVALTYTILMRDSTTEDPKTGLTVTGQRSLDGAALAALSGVITEIGNGLYKVAAVAADMNGDTATHRFTSAGAKDLIVEFVTQA